MISLRSVFWGLILISSRFDYVKSMMSLMTCTINVEQSSAGFRYLTFTFSVTSLRLVSDCTKLTIPFSGVFSSWDIECTMECLYLLMSSSIDSRFITPRSLHISVYTCCLKRKSLYKEKDSTVVSWFSFRMTILPPISDQSMSPSSFFLPLWRQTCYTIFLIRSVSSYF